MQAREAIGTWMDRADRIAIGNDGEMDDAQPGQMVIAPVTDAFCARAIAMVTEARAGTTDSRTAESARLMRTA